jgi:hypothetical protein
MLIMFVVTPIAGPLYNYVDGRLLIGAGVAMMRLGYFDLARLTLEVGPAEAGLPLGTATDSALKMLGGMVNRHATMMAYNDVFWMMGMLFVVELPFLIMLGGRPSRLAPAPVPHQTAIAMRG